MKKEVKDTIITELGQKLQEFPHFYLVDDFKIRDKK